MQLLKLNKKNRPQGTKPIVLVIYPHPDDETYMIGGLLDSLARHPDITPVVITLTKGESWQISKSYNPKGLIKARKQAGNLEELAATRVHEWQLAMDHLRVKHAEIGSLPDGLLEQEEELVAALLKEYIQIYNPQAVITYDEVGFYGHPDHIVVSKILSNLQENFNYRLIFSVLRPIKLQKMKLPYYMAANADLIKKSHKQPQYYYPLSFKQRWHKLKAIRAYKSQHLMSWRQQLSLLLLDRYEYFHQHPNNQLDQHA